MEIKIDKASKQPIYAQIVTQITALAEKGELKADERLPSAKDLSDQLDITPPTVTRAYEVLEDNGVVFSQRGRGTFILGHPSTLNPDANAAGNKLFISYAREDEIASYGAISSFKDAIKKQFKLLTGDGIDVFFDTDSISCGKDWRKTIKDNIGNTIIFMPFLSPSFLKSTNCMGELRSAYLSFKERNMQDAILPIRFVDYGHLLRNLEDDELALLISNKNWTDFTELQYEDPSSPIYRKAIKNLILDIIERSNNIYQALDAFDPDSSELEDDDAERYGLLEATEAFQNDTNEITEHLKSFGSIVEEMGDTAKEHTANIEKSSGSFKEKILIIKDFSRTTEPLADKLEDEVDSICMFTNKADKDVGVILDFFEEWDSDESTANLEDFKSFGDAIIELNKSSLEAFEGTSSFRASTVALSKLSRDLRSPLNKVQNSLDRFLSLEKVFSSWAKRSEDLLRQLNESHC